MMKKFMFLNIILVFLSGNYSYGMEQYKQHEYFNYNKIKKIENIARLEYYTIKREKNNSKEFQYKHVACTKNTTQVYTCKQTWNKSNEFKYLNHEFIRNSNSLFKKLSLIAIYDNKDENIKAIYLGAKSICLENLSKIIKSKLLVKEIKDLWKENGILKNFNSNKRYDYGYRWAFISFSGRTIHESLDAICCSDCPATWKMFLLQKKHKDIEKYCDFSKLEGEYKIPCALENT